MDTWMIVIAGIVGGSLLFRWYEKTKLRRAGVVEVNVNEGARMIEEDGALVLDVREGREYASGRIPRSRHLPLSQLDRQMGDLERDRDRPIIVSCRSGRRSAHAGIYLCRHGFSKVYNLKGGVNAWVRSNRKVER